ncbi:MAG: MFS transporter [Thalassobaculales bacterium]
MLGLSPDFRRIFVVDLIVRTAYQMGKTPVLPLFAAAIGAGHMLTGSIVAVSTLTGLVLKPLFGALSDRWGRRLWFFIALCVFTFTPFLYWFVTSPEQLFALRLFHGTATAIFGPVTLAVVAEMDRAHQATRLGWFDLAREGGYLIAPALAGGLLTVMPPEQVFVVIGFVSAVAFLPALRMGFATPPIQAAAQRPGLWRQFSAGLAFTISRIALWYANALEIAVYTITYGIKAFLPLFVLQDAKLGVFAAGLFFTVQEAAHMLSRPVGGWLGDRIGFAYSIAGGMALIAMALMALPGVSAESALLAVAVVSGIGMGLIFPSTIALVGGAVSAGGHLGLGMGVYGSCKNLGKVAGPLVSGALLQAVSYTVLFQGMAVAMACAAGIVVLSYHQRLRRAA